MDRKAKKEILLFPVLETKKSGCRVKAMTRGDILALDCWKNAGYLGRYLIDREGKHEFYGEEKSVCGLTWVFERTWYISREIEPDTLKDEERMKAFLNTKSNPIQRIELEERCYNAEKREEAELREKERIKKKMEKVSPLTDGFYAWCEETVFTEQYAIRRSKNTYYCTACARQETGEVKHNRRMICSGGHEVIGKTRQAIVEQTEYCMVLQMVDENLSAARHFKLHRVCTQDGQWMSAAEEIRMLMGKTGDKKLEIYYGMYRDQDETGQRWWKTNPANERHHTGYCYPEGAQEALRGTRYERIGIPEMAQRKFKVQYNNVMANYPVAKVFEYLAKTDLERLARETSERMHVYGGYYGPVRLSGKTEEEVLGVDRQRALRLRQADGGVVYLEWLRYEKSTGKKIPEETLKKLEKYGIVPTNLDFICKKMSPTQIVNYIERQCQKYKKSVRHILEQWEDYLLMAKKLGMDTDDEIIYRTKNLIERHNELADRISAQKDDDLAEEMRKKFPEVEAVMKRIHDIYTYAGKEYLIRVPERINEIIKDSQKLHHCAAGSERYYERIQAEETYIVFLRKAEKPEEPFYTLEVEPGGTIRQKRSMYNRQPDVEKLTPFLREWQKEIKKRMGEDDKKKAEKSSVMRSEEMKALEESERERDRQLYDSLMGDLMEAI